MVVKLFCEVISFILGLCWRRNKKIWVFGAWDGNLYSDNSKYFFEYVQKNKEKLEIRPIWVTKNTSVLMDLREQGYEVYHRSSIYAWFYCLNAGVSFFTHRINDINYRGLLFKSRLIQLWHGMPLKKINFDVEVESNFIIKIKRFIQKLEFRRYSLLIATSESTKETINSSFLTSKTKVTGLPRNDVFVRETDINTRSTFNITFMPTFRDNEDKSYLYFLEEENILDLYLFLKEKNAKLFLKLHRHDLNSIKVPEKYSNVITLVSDIDTQLLLLETDLLITDYSSCFIDYLILNRPIIFSVPDIENYQKKERDFYYDFNSISPGKKVKSYIELKNAISTYYNDQSIDSKDRVEVRGFFHKDNEGLSYSEKLVEELRIENIL